MLLLWAVAVLGGLAALGVAAADLGPAGLLRALHEESEERALFAAVRGRLAEVEPERELERAEQNRPEAR